MDETPWLTARELRAWTRFESVAELLPGALDQQLQRDAGLTHFEYLVLARLSEAPGRTLRMSALAAETNATLPRLSHVAARLEARGLVARRPCPEDKRATLGTLTDEGWQKVVATAPGHVDAVRRYVVDRLTAEQIGQLDRIAYQLLGALDPENRLRALDGGTEDDGRGDDGRGDDGSVPTVLTP